MKFKYKSSTVKKILLTLLTILVFLFTTYNTSKLYTYTTKELKVSK
ncbi:hypothetical protein [Hathewaya histolytica]|nr:hypothetical protein [Hathewaya histolytica]